MGLTQKLGTIPLAIQTDSSNNVGIGGTPSGSFKLEVTGASKLSGFLGVNGSPATSFPFEAYINSSTAYTTSSRGNVMRVYNSNTGANVFAGIELGGAGTANDGLAGINAIVTGSGSAALTFYVRNGGTFAERYRVAPDGKLLINTTTAYGGSMLQVNGFAKANGFNVSVASTLSGYLLPQGEWTGVASNNLAIAAETGNDITFYTNGSATEKARITTGGDLYVNTTGNYGVTSVLVRSAWSAGSYGQLSFYTGTGNATIRSSVPGNSTNGMQILTYWSGNGDKITANFDGYGNVYNYNNSTTWQQTSDIRIKENIRPINDALGKLCALNPSHFEYKNNKGVTKTGFIAQEFEKVFPGHTLEAAPSDDLKQYFEEGEMMKAIDADLIPYLVKAIQELTAKVTALENR